MFGYKQIVLLLAAAILTATAFLSLHRQGEGFKETSDIRLNNIEIAIDPGHGGVDGGASLNGSFDEKDINLAISLKLKTLLENAGAKVVLTRDTDISLEDRSDLHSSRYKRDLDARRDIVNNSSVDVSVSIHTNCFRSNPNSKGAIIFFYYGSEEGKRLAQAIGDSINDRVYAGFLGNTALKSKVLPENLFMLRSINVPGILVEVGYMTNYEEGRLLRQEEFQAAMAEAIYNGLKNYFKEKIHSSDC